MRGAQTRAQNLTFGSEPEGQPKMEFLGTQPL